jgi:hypothetical protein
MHLPTLSGVWDDSCMISSDKLHGARIPTAAAADNGVAKGRQAEANLGRQWSRMKTVSVQYPRKVTYLHSPVYSGSREEAVGCVEKLPREAQ